MADSMFRKAALDKVSSPEQLDLMMQVTSPMGWLALVTIGVILIIAGVWSVMGSIPELVDGNGTLFRGERMREVLAPMEGTIKRLVVRKDMVIQKDQVIAEIRRVEASSEKLLSDQMTIAKNSAMITAKRQEKGTLQAQYGIQAQLVQQGLKPQSVLLEWQQKIIAVDGEINSLEQQTGALQASLASTTEVRSSDAGRVIEVLKSQGDQLRAGEPIIRIEPQSAEAAGAQTCGGNVHVILYVPANLAGKVKRGQEVHVSPLEVKKEEFGYIYGKVEQISTHAASSEDMLGKLHNDALVKEFAGGGPVYEARICLDADPKNKYNGLRWSSTGPPKAIDPGLSCTASVMVDSKRPYTYIIPMVRRTMGL